MKTVGLAAHDHASCVAERIAAAERYCSEHQLHFTPVRRRAFEILLEEHRALGAYELLERLKGEGFGAQPPVAYRSLEFLTRYGLVHRIEYLNAYVASVRPFENAFPAFLICKACDRVAEVTADPSRGILDLIAEEACFVVEKTVVEAVGICDSCRAEGLQ